ncbi:MAG: ABC transporter permease subunit [Chloroflexi bacterium]|nr:ABC transporter permease subunit [Chloroflexota bacterium]
MSLALFRVSLKLSQWAIVGWIAFLFLYGLFVVYVYPFASHAEGLQQFLKSLPEPMLRSFGLSQGAIDDLLREGGFTFNGWLVTRYFGLWPIILGIYAFTNGSGLVAREAERGTIELLFSHPLPRHQLVTSKLAAFLTTLALMVASSLAGIFVGSLFVEHVEVGWGSLLMTLVAGSMLVGAIMAYSTLLSCLVLDPRRTMAIAGGVMAASYILNFLLPSLESLAWMARLSLFYYYQPYDVLLHGGFPITGALVYGGVTAVCLALAIVVFNRRKALL